LSRGILSLIHVFFSVTLRANRIACGIGLKILGIGLTVSLGHFLIGMEDWSHRAESNRGHPHYE
jgi:ABC-type uncharacterized transport system permease subunit